MKMKRSNLNYLIDIIMFILMMAILGIGFLMKFVLITGQERWIRYGRNVDITFWGMDRHEWGMIHLILGLILIAVLILHLILHWRSIVKFFRNFSGNRSIRISVTSILLIVSISLIILPFLVPINVAELEYGYGYGRQQINYSKSISDTYIVAYPDSLLQPKKKQVGISEHQDINKIVQRQRKFQRQELQSEIEIRGYMTLRKVSEKYDVQADRIKEKLGIPVSTSDDERLGRLRQWYGFTMSDVREAIFAERN